MPQQRRIINEPIETFGLSRNAQRTPPTPHTANNETVKIWKKNLKGYQLRRIFLFINRSCSYSESEISQCD